MANELLLSGALEYQKGNSPVKKWSAVARGLTLSGNVLVGGLVKSVGTSEEAIPLDETSGSLGYCVVENLDDTNYVSILTGTGGTNIIKIPPRKFALFHFGSGVTAPYIIANTAACLVEIWIFAQ